MTQPIIHDPNGYEAVAAELRRVADALETVLPGGKPFYVSLNIQAGRPLAPDAADAVDAVALAVLGKKGEAREVGSGKIHHHATDPFRPVNVSIYQQVPGPRDAELEELRARVAELESANARKDEQVTGDDGGKPLHGLHPEDDGITLCGLYPELLSDSEGITQDRDRLSCNSCRAALVVSAYVPQFGEPGYPGCPGCSKSVGSHDDGCSEDES